MFLEASDFSFTKTLEASWGEIRQELDRLSLEQFKPWYEKNLYTNLWLVYGLYFFGKKIKANCEACPRTTEILGQIPNLVTAGFSALMPGTRIRPHRGYTRAVLRCHLGVQVPEPEKCVLKVNGVERSWQEGKCLVFDDTSEHQAWNVGQTPRIVLLLDFKNDRGDVPVSEKIKFFAMSVLARFKT